VQRLLTDPDPSLRATFEELVLKDGEFRWRRLANLLRESTKSLSVLPSDKLWLTVQWLLGPEAAPIRTTVVEVRSAYPRACGKQQRAARWSLATHRAWPDALPVINASPGRDGWEGTPAVRGGTP
jgi:hypothetical protein